MHPSKTILTVFAHPDDEVFGAGGVAAHYAEQGERVVIACVTRGEAGEISDPALATPETIGAVREGELRTAATALGVTDVRMLEFRDAGMAGTPENEDPRTLHRTPPEEATRRMVAVIRAVRPDVVITHDPTGGYGHPDHIATCQYVTAAFDAAGDAAQFPTAGEAWQPARLYYNVVPKSFFKDLREQMQRQGLDTAQWDTSAFEALGVTDEEVTHLIDVSAHFARKQAAFAAHRTQFGADSPIKQMPEALQREVFGREVFVQARPQLNGEFVQQHDLFSY